MAKAFSTWIGARNQADCEWPQDLRALYEACRTAYILQAEIDYAASKLPSGGITGRQLGESSYDAMAVWQRLEQIAAPHFASWERWQRLPQWFGLGQRVTPRIVPVVTQEGA